MITPFQENKAKTKGKIVFFRKENELEDWQFWTWLKNNYKKEM
jgi:hypothetical protein